MRAQELEQQVEQRDRTIHALRGQVSHIEGELSKARRDLESALAASTSATRLAADRKRILEEVERAVTESKKRWARDREVLEAQLREARDEIANLRQRPSLPKLVGDTIRNVKGGAR